MKNPPPIYIVSGGVGASGEQLVYTVLAQFPEQRVPVFTVGNVRQLHQIEDVVQRALESGGTIVHTLVDDGMRQHLVELAREQGVVAIDLMGDLLGRLSELLGRQPLRQPGLYRKLNQQYYERVSAIEFAMVHDDGKAPEDWPSADLVLIGVSRSGKTPLSLYLSVLGWKVANVPLFLGMTLPDGLFQLDRQRIFGLSVEAGQLLLFRQQRQKRLGMTGPSYYTDPGHIEEELAFARQVFRQGGFSVIDVTDKPIESSADEIIRLLGDRFKVWK